MSTEKNITRESLVRIPLIAAAALLLSLTELFGETSPYALVFLTSLTGMNCVWALSGSLIGLFVSGTFISSINMLSVMIIVTAFRVLTARFNPSPWINITASVLSGAGVFMMTLILSDSVNAVFTAPALGLAAGFGSWAAGGAKQSILSGRNLSVLRPAGFAALGISYIMLISVLTNFGLAMLNPGITAASLIAVTFSYRFRYSGGAIAGILGAFGIAVTNSDFMAGALVIPAAAVAACLFARLGKYTQMAGYVLFTGIFVAFSGINSFSFAEINSVIAGALIFLFLPSSLLTERFRSDKAVRGSGAEVSEIFAHRLRLTGEAMGDVRTAIEKTAEILDRVGSKDIAWVYNTACGEVCRRCRHNMTCWGTEYDDTVRIMHDLASLLQKGKLIKPDHLYGTLGYRCGKREQLAAALNAQYREYTAINTANRKIAQMRTILLSQISATQMMMKGMSEEFGSSSDFDRPLAASVEAVLFENGISEPKVAVTVSEARLNIEAYGKGRLRTDSQTLCGLISSAIGKEFDLPDIVHSNSEFYLTMFERAAFSIDYGVFQMSRGKEKNCGDYFDSFIDKKGFAYIILSDGMGSGGRARIDSAFACGMLVKLLRAGVDISAAIEMINNSLLVKSADESFATLDVCRIDLYSGNVELFKAGSAPTYISCNRKVVKAAGKGLPVGINHRPVYERQSFTIGHSDLIIMASDGAELSERWLEHELSGSERDDITDMNSFAKNIATAAKYAADKEREDDISVVAVRLIK